MYKYSKQHHKALVRLKAMLIQNGSSGLLTYKTIEELVTQWYMDVENLTKQVKLLQEQINEADSKGDRELGNKLCMQAGFKNRDLLDLSYSIDRLLGIEPFEQE